MPIKPKELIFCLLILVGCANISLSQNYLSAEQDVGFDIARTIVADATIRTEPKDIAPIVTTFKSNYSLTLLNRKTVGGWYEVSDINTLKRGWIHGNQITLSYSNGNFRQTAKTETKCAEPLYLSADEDNGYDIIKLKPTWDSKGVKSYPIMWLIESDGSEFKTVGRTFKRYDNETNLLLLSRNLDDLFSETTYLKALDLKEGIIGYVSCSNQTYYTRKQKQETESPFVKQRSSNSYAAPVTTVQNDADRDLTLFIDDVKYTVPSKSTKTLTLSAGRHSYIATAPGVIPLSGSDVWEQGYVYTWTFYIVTRSR